MLYLQLSPRLGVREPGFQAGVIGMSSMAGSGVDGTSACGVNVGTECNGRIEGSVAGAEVVEEPDEVAGADGPGDESLFLILLIL